MRSDQYHIQPGSFRDRVCLCLYTLLWILLTPVFTVVMLRRDHHNGLKELRRIPERFGFGPRFQRTGGYLFHCVSVGEVVAAAPLIKQLQTLRPDESITVTTTTSTGSERLQALFESSVQHCYLPFDMPFTMGRLLKRLKPSQLVIVEVELWPSMIDRCWHSEIPVVVINARMTNRSVHRYRKLSALAGPMLKKLSKVCVQGHRDYENYLQLGVDKDRLLLTNNIKFDLPSIDADKLKQATSQRYATNGRTVIVAGSTHAPEETLLLETYQQLKADHKNLLLVLVPRHPQRFETVFQLCQEKQLTVNRASSSIPCEPATDILLADQMGILRQLYSVADIAFVGGSLANRGGHNALEPAQLGIPILMGPSQYNNPQICSELQASGALCIVRDQSELINQCRYWLKEPERAKRKGLSGQHTIAENTGALQATLEILIT